MHSHGNNLLGNVHVHVLLAQRQLKINLAFCLDSQQEDQDKRKSLVGSNEDYINGE
jgi:hypothetical protein